MRNQLLLAGFSLAALFATGALAQDAPNVLTGADAFGSWEESAPGVVRHITPEDQPPPGATEAVSNAPGVVARPDDAMPAVMEGFKVELVASGIANPRHITFAPNGDLFVANSEAGEVDVYRVPAGSAKPSEHAVFASGLTQPYGIAFYPQDDPQWVYVGESNGVKRFPYKAGDMTASGDPETLFSDIPAGYHWTRSIAFAPDGNAIYYAVGSGSNVAEQVKGEPDGGLEAWVKDHAPGAMWGAEEWRADVLAYDPDGKNGRVFATGLRNCSGLTIQPATGDLWCVVNERDMLGDNVPYDYATRVEDGGFYGWPWYYIGQNEDTRPAVKRPDLAETVIVPDVLFQAHSAPLNIAFYTGDAFGAEYDGDAFVALHGSWNRGARTGYKIVRLIFDDSGNATGEYQDFVTGFVQSREDVWGRPVGVAVAPDGSLFFSEDGSGTIWRVSKE